MFDVQRSMFDVSLNGQARHPRTDRLHRLGADRSFVDDAIGRFLFVEEAEYFRHHGIREVVISPRTKEFGAYLVKVGFEEKTNAGAARVFHIRYDAAREEILRG